MGVAGGRSSYLRDDRLVLQLSLSFLFVAKCDKQCSLGVAASSADCLAAKCYRTYPSNQLLYLKKIKRHAYTASEAWLLLFAARGSDCCMTPCALLVGNDTFCSAVLHRCQCYKHKRPPHSSRDHLCHKRRQISVHSLRSLWSNRSMLQRAGCSVLKQQQLEQRVSISSFLFRTTK